MTAPDPVLTDLIAAALYAAIAKAAKSGTATVDDLVASVIPVVEQHTNGRITELEARVDDWSAEYRKEIQARDNWRARAEKAEATIARVEKLQRDLFQQGGNLIAQWGAARLIRAALQEEFIRAALEGEQQ